MIATTLLAALALPALAPLARADTPTAARIDHARDLKKRGDGLMDLLRYAEAYSLYAEAYAISADPALLYNEGRALEAMGDYPRAIAALEQFAKSAPPEVLALVPALPQLLADVRSRVSTLIVTCNIEKARVLVRDQFVGMVHFTGTFPVRAGKATLDVIADGYEPFHTEIDLPGGDKKAILVTMVERHDLATVIVKSPLAGSLVSLDANAFGPVPIEARVPPGSHVVLVQHEGYRDARLPIFLVAGEHRSLDVSMDKGPAITQRWWFWTGVGVVAAGIVVTAIALESSKSPTSGSFSPGQVRF
jgi:hypothetical protein